MPEDLERRDTPTDIAPPMSEEDGPITQPPAKLETMLPASIEGSYFQAAAKEFAGAAAELRKTRASIEQGFRDQEASANDRHAEVTANQQLVASAIRAHGDRLIALEHGQSNLERQIAAAQAAANEAVSLARQALSLVADLKAQLPLTRQD
jgi:uncharacterized protein (DUF3084 family)